MSINIRLEPVAKKYHIVRKECPNCDAKFVFRVADKEVKEVLGDGIADLGKKTVECKTCLSTFKYEVDDTKPFVDFS
jgi:hypothetical protein